MTAKEYQKLVQTAKQRLVDEIDNSDNPEDRAAHMRKSYLHVDRLAAELYFQRKTE